MPALRPALAELRSLISEIDGTGSHQHGVLPFAVRELDQRPPQGGLSLRDP